MFVTSEKLEGSTSCITHCLNQIWVFRLLLFWYLLIFLFFWLCGLFNFWFLFNFFLFVERCDFLKDRNEETTSVLVMRHNSSASFKLLENFIIVEIGEHGFSDQLISMTLFDKGLWYVGKVIEFDEI